MAPSLRHGPDGGPATADGPGAAVASATRPAVELAPVIVSASKPRLYDTPDVNAGALGVRDMQDQPFSVGSFTADSVENQRARTALDALRNDPSVTPVTYGASFYGVAVRGFSANTFNNVRRDGLLANVDADVPLENKERIDVLKGVSGFLYGVGDPSGLVNYVVKRPTRDPLLDVTAEVHSASGYYASVDTGDPDVDGKRPANVARFRASAFLDYRLQSIDGLSINGGYYYIGNRPLTGTDDIIVDGAGRWDLGAAYTLRAAGKPTVIRLSIFSVADKRYWESVVYGTVGMARSRTAVLSVTTQF